MAREPELGIKVKVEPQISATDITNAVEKVTPDGGVPIKVKISNVKQAMSSFAADQKKDSSSWPLINVKINNAKEALDNAFKKISTDIDVNISDASVSNIKAKLKDALKDVSINAAVNTKTVTGSAKTAKAPKTTSAKPRALNVTASQISSTATQLGKLEEKVNAIQNADLSSAFLKAKSDFDTFVNSADHSITSFTNLKTAIGNIEQQVSQLNTKTPEISDASVLKDYESSINRIIKLQKELSKISSEQSPATYDLTNTKLIQEQTNLEKLKQTVEARGLAQQQEYINSNNLYEKSIQAITEAQNQRRIAEQQAVTATDADSTSIQKKINRLNGYVNALQKANVTNPDVYGSINQELDLATNFLNAIRESSNIDIDTQRFFNERDISGINDFRSGVDYIESRVANINALVNDALDTKRLQNASIQANTMLQNLKSTVSDYLSKNGNILNTDLASQFFGLENSLNADNAAQNIRELQNTFSALRAQAKSLGLETEGLTQKFTNLFSEHFATGLTMAALHTMENSLQVILQSVIDIDTAMTELRKVTNETAEGYEQYMGRASDVANDLGVSLTDYINSTSEWARLGYDLDQSEELARMSTLLANVGDGIQNAADASSYLISIIQGFHLDTSEVEHVVDVMNEVANTQPIDAEGIAEILTRSAASMAAAGNTLEQTIALGTAAFATTQNAEKTGNALRSISLFLRAAKTEAEDLNIDTQGMANSVSELREEVLQLTGIDIMANPAGTEFKSTYQILKEISEVYDDLADVDQANLTELLAGKHTTCQNVQKCA